LQWSFAAISKTDLDDILEIERSSFRRPWSRLSFLDELVCENAYAYAARMDQSSSNDALVGYIFFRLIFNEMHVLKVAVTPMWRGQGIASGLVKKSIALAVSKGATRAFLEVRPSNQPAISFYHKTGFEIVGKRKRYYAETGEDALVMSSNLRADLGALRN
jgi:ribosomal-protein-alanine N-acetyltransferase